MRIGAFFELKWGCREYVTSAIDLHTMVIADGILIGHSPITGPLVVAVEFRCHRSLASTMERKQGMPELGHCLCSGEALVTVRFEWHRAAMPILGYLDLARSRLDVGADLMDEDTICRRMPESADLLQPGSLRKMSYTGEIDRMG
ncbi:hypothetical protein ACLOJK_024304 [Asimina triloba]